MSEAVIYPPQIRKDKDRLFACYSLIQQMIDEHNRQSTLASESKLSGEFRTYTKEQFDPRLKQVLAERNRLMEKIRWENYTPEEWQKATDTPEKQMAVHESLFGSKSAEKAKPTLATSPVLDELKAIDITKLSSLEGVDPVEDFTTYTEVDPAPYYITKDANTATFTALPRNVDAYVYKDKTAAHFAGDFEHLFQMNLVSSDANGIAIYWALANLINDAKGIDDANGDELYVEGYRATAPPYYRIYTVECDGGTLYSDYGEISVNTDYYLRVKRDEGIGSFGTLYGYIYSDESRQTLVDTLSVALHTSKKDFRYIYALQTWNSGDSYAQSGYVEDLDLQEGWTNISHDKGVLASAMSHKKGVAVADIAYVKATPV